MLLNEHRKYDTSDKYVDSWQFTVLVYAFSGLCFNMLIKNPFFRLTTRKGCG